VNNTIDRLFLDFQSWLPSNPLIYRINKLEIYKFPKDFNFNIFSHQPKELFFHYPLEALEAKTFIKNHKEIKISADTWTLEELVKFENSFPEFKCPTYENSKDTLYYQEG